MTRREIAVLIEAETHSRTWVLASLETRLEVIESCMLSGEGGEAKEAVKKKTRKPRAKPLAQHAVAAGEDE